jgi:hypothetical protein
LALRGGFPDAVLDRSEEELFGNDSRLTGARQDQGRLAKYLEALAARGAAARLRRDRG